MSDKAGVVLDGEEILEKPSDRINWDNPAARDRFKTAVRDSLAEKLHAISVDVGKPISGEELMDRVYDHKILFRDIVDNVQEFITQARVREWDPEQAQTKVETYQERRQRMLDQASVTQRLKCKVTKVPVDHQLSGEQ